MAITEIVQIPVDDSEFQAFSAAFNKYHETLKGMPAEWGAVNQRIVELAKFQRQLGVSADKAWSNATSAASNYEKAVGRAGDAQAKLARATVTSEAALKRMGNAVKGISGGLFSAVRSMAGMATFGIGGALLGLGGGLFGLDALAHGVLERQRMARGFGMTTGQLASFQTFMKPYVGSGVLAGAAAAQMDITKTPYLSMLGINPAVAQRESAGALAFQEVLAVHRAYQRNPRMFMQTPAGMAAAQLGFSAQDMRLAGVTPSAELRAAYANYEKNKNALGFSSKVAQEWTAFSVQLHKAGVLIETALINTLTPLTPQLTKLSGEIANFIVGLEKSGAVKTAVAELAHGIGDFAKWLDSPAFKADMKTFAADISDLARETVRALRWLGLIPGGEPTHQQFVAAAAQHPAKLGALGDEMNRLGQNAEIRGQRLLGAYSPTNLHKFALAQTGRYNLPRGLLDSVLFAESGYGVHLRSPAGALGPMQLMPGTAALFNADPLNAASSVQAGARYLADLYAQYGSWRKALAAYNWGPGNLDRDITQHGANWMKFLPAETKRYLTETYGSGAGATDAQVAKLLSGRVSAPARKGVPITTSQMVGFQHEADSLGDSWTRMRSYPARSGSDTARTRARYWATHHKPTITVHNNTAAQVHISANAAAQ